MQIFALCESKSIPCQKSSFTFVKIHCENEFGCYKFLHIAKQKSGLQISISTENTFCYTEIAAKGL